jgi:hypothetical protein
MTNQGSEANEAAYKLALQYHTKEKADPEPSRTLFIARERSYHGATLGALDLSGHKARRELYEPVIPHNTHHISPCYSYRGLRTGETIAEYVRRLKDELEQKIIELGPKNVAAFICEPVVGAVSLISSRSPVIFRALFLQRRAHYICNTGASSAWGSGINIIWQSLTPTLLIPLAGTWLRSFRRRLPYSGKRRLQQIWSTPHL